MAKSPDSFPHDNPDEDLILESIELDRPEAVEPNIDAGQKQPKKETKPEAKEEDSFTAAGKIYERGRAVKIVIKKDDGSEYIEDWKFSGVTTHPSTGKKIIVIENKEGGRMNYPMDMFEEGLGGRQLETSLRFEDRQGKPKKSASAEAVASKAGVKPEIKEEQPSVADLLLQARGRLENIKKSTVPDWLRKSRQDEVKELQERLKNELQVGGGDTVKVVAMEEVGMKGDEMETKEFTPEELEKMGKEFSRLPVSIGGPNVHHAIIRFLEVKGSSYKDLIFVFAPEEGRTFSIDDKEANGIQTSTIETKDLGAARKTTFKPKKQLDFGGRKIREVRLFVGSKVPEEMREELGDIDFQKKTVDYAERILKKNKGKENNVSIPIVKGLTGIDSPEAWKMREESNFDNGIEFATSLSGIDSKKAWDYRDKYFKGRSYYEAGNSLVGLDSPQAWDMRENILRASKAEKSRAGIDALINSLAGIDSPEAWKMREHLSKAGSGDSSIVASLTGLDSKKAWEMRDRLIKTRKKGDYIAEGVAKSLAGIDSPEAWKMRELLLAQAAKDGKGEESGEKNSVMRRVLEGLSGVDSPQAWKMREDLLKEGKFLDEIARSMAGIDSDRAWNMRGRLIIEGCHEDTVLRGIYGGTDMVAVRKARRDKKNKRK